MKGIWSGLVLAGVVAVGTWWLVPGVKAQERGRSESAAAGGSATSCTALSSLQLPNVVIGEATVVMGGSFTPPAATPAPAAPPAGRGGRGPVALENLPTFCRVAGKITNHPTSNIKFEVWLPLDNANHRFVQVGNGGYAGNISYAALAARVREGYAAASTDDGTSPSSDKSFLGDLERVADFKGRAVTLTTAASKAIFARFYSSPPVYSYFVGCSSGGLEALAAAQREPDQFNGIVGGDPAFNSAGLFTQALWTAKYYEKLSTKAQAIHTAVLAKCDKDDGVEDGVVGNPEKCDFDPATLACPSGTDSASCLTAEQVDAARKIYEGPVNPANGKKTGEEYAPGMPRGSELAWAGSVGQATGTSQPWYGEVLYGKPTFDMASFDFGADVAKALAKTKPYGAQVTDTDLSKLKAKGAKLLLYNGWNDPLWSGGDILRYYKEVAKKQGGLDKAADFARIFMVPGMGHCGGGDGPNVFDNFTPMVNWVEHGTAPESLLATKYVNNQQAQGVERTRPICAYPRFAKWKGTGDPLKGENFACVTQ